MPPRKPPKEPEQRLARWSRSMSPGTLNGRVASATPMGLDLSRLAPRLRSQPQPTGNDAASMSRISVANRAPAAITAGTWHQMTFGSTEEVIGTDLVLSSGLVVINADGIYTVTAQVNWIGASPALPAGTHCAVDVGPYPNLDAYFRTENDPTEWLNASFSTAIFPPYFIAAGTTVQANVAVIYPSGGPCAPSAFYLNAQRVA